MVPLLLLASWSGERVWRSVAERSRLQPRRDPPQCLADLKLRSFLPSASSPLRAGVCVSVCVCVSVLHGTVRLTD